MTGKRHIDHDTIAALAQEAGVRETARRLNIKVRRIYHVLHTNNIKVTPDQPLNRPCYDHGLIRELGALRMPYREIARRCGCDVRAVRRVLGPSKQYTYHNHERIRSVRDADPKLSYKEIARVCGCDPKTIRRALGRNQRSAVQRDYGPSQSTYNGEDGRLRIGASNNAAFMAALAQYEKPPASLVIKPTAPVFFPRAEHHSSTGAMWE